MKQGDIFRKIGKFKKAGECYEKVKELDPYSYKILERLANLYHNNLKDHKKALYYIKKIYEKDKDDPIAIFHLASAYNENNRFDEAIHYFENLLGLCGEDTELLHDLGLVYMNKKDYHNAITYFKEV